MKRGKLIETNYQEEWRRVAIISNKQCYIMQSSSRSPYYQSLSNGALQNEVLISFL